LERYKSFTFVHRVFGNLTALITESERLSVRYLYSISVRYCAGLLVLLSGIAAWGQITVDAPLSPPSTPATVNTPFYLQAQAPTCNSAATTSFGYSIDTGATTYVSGTTIQTMLSPATGAHTIYLKAYNGTGFECDTTQLVSVGGGVTVAAPSLSATLPETFNLDATAPTCGGQTTTLMSYGVDSQSTTSADAITLNTLVDSNESSGSHILRVKAFAGSMYCETDIPFTVTGGIAAGSGANLYTGTPTSYPYSGIESLSSYTGTYAACPSGSVGPGLGGANETPDIGLWQTQPDCGTVGTKSNVSTTYPTTTEVHGFNSASRQVSFTYGSTGGGVRLFNGLPDNTNANAATHFLYDVYLYIAPGSDVGQIEMDINHASPANDLYLIGVQCNLVNGTWDVTEYPNGWKHTSTSCTNLKVTTGAWHHLQVLTNHAANPGTAIDYDQISVDGVVETLSCDGSACASTMESKPWAESVGPNFQLDGGGAGGSRITAYVSNFNIWYW
jgi:hypothetical protein